MNSTIEGAEPGREQGPETADGTVEPEVAMLREDLALCRQELAQAREREEPLREELARLSYVEKQCEALSKAFAGYLGSRQRLSEPLQVLGWRGRLVRWLVGDVSLFRPLPIDPQVQAILASGLFDAGWYLRTYQDVASASESPVVHYLHHGAREGRATGPGFDTAFYVARYPDVLASGLNPLIHYLEIGKAEGRLPVPPRFFAAGDARGEA